MKLSFILLLYLFYFQAVPPNTNAHSRINTADWLLKLQSLALTFYSCVTTIMISPIHVSRTSISSSFYWEKVQHAFDGNNVDWEYFQHSRSRARNSKRKFSD